MLSSGLKALRKAESACKRAAENQFTPYTQPNSSKARFIILINMVFRLFFTFFRSVDLTLGTKIGAQ